MSLLIIYHHFKPKNSSRRGSGYPSGVPLAGAGPSGTEIQLPCLRAPGAHARGLERWDVVGPDYGMRIAVMSLMMLDGCID